MRMAINGLAACKCRTGAKASSLEGDQAGASCDVRTLDGGKISAGAGYKKFKPLLKRTAIPAERRKGREGAHSSPAYCHLRRESCAKSDEFRADGKESAGGIAW
jgi:hypothetical protein